MRFQNNIQEMIIIFKKINYLRTSTMLLSLLIVSCDGKKDNKNSSYVKEAQRIKVKAKENISFEFLRGVWVRKDYIDNLEKTKSTFKSSSKLNNISSIILRDHQNNSNHTTIGLCLNNSEGTSTILYEKDSYFFLDLFDENGRIPTKIKIINDFLSFNYLKEEYIFSRISKDVFSNDASFGINYITNSILFNKKVFSDETKEGFENITFSKDGKVKNFNGYESYEIITGYDTDPNPMDKIIFRFKNTNESHLFHYVFKEGNLLLYKIIENDDSEEHSSLELTFTLKEISKHR